MAAPKTLVVFYSRSGTTRKVAEALAAELKCDAEELVPTESRASFFGILRSTLEAIRQRPARIAATHRDPSSYDLVVIGTPVWAWSVSSPVRAYLMAKVGKLPDVAFFCTAGNTGDKGTFAQMQGLAGKTPSATAAFLMRDVTGGRFMPRLAEFAQALASPKA